MKIFITGIAGFIGTNLAIKMASDGHQVYGIDSLVSKTSNSIVLRKYNIKLIEKSISELTSGDLDDTDVVVHLAALGNVVQSVENPVDNFNSNVLQTVHLLECLKNSKCKKLIFSSTGGALMGNTPPPVDESSVPQPISPYGASKLCCEGYISAYCNSYEIQAVIFRFGNVYGKYSLHKSGVLNVFIKRALRGESLSIYGSVDSTRDYIHVQDICQGITKGIEYLTSKKFGDSILAVNTFHLANNQQISLGYIHTQLETILTKKIPFACFPTRSGEVLINSASYAKANEILNFNPTVSFKDGLRSLVDYFLECI